MNAMPRYLALFAYLRAAPRSGPGPLEREEGDPLPDPQGDAEWATDPETGERRLKLELWLGVAAMMNREEAERGRRRAAAGPSGMMLPSPSLLGRVPQATPGAGRPHG
jgi:hypothetical protein